MCEPAVNGGNTALPAGSNSTLTTPSASCLIDLTRACRVLVDMKKRLFGWSVQRKTVYEELDKSTSRRAHPSISTLNSGNTSAFTATSVEQG